MKNNTISALVFSLLLALIAFASSPQYATRLNDWVHAQFGDRMALSSEVSTSEPKPADADTAEPAETEGAQQPAAPEETGGEATGEDAAAVPSPDAPAAAGEGKAADATVTPDAAGSAVQAEIVVPSFSLLRVEPDGSTLIAGQAAPKAEIEVLSGADTLATTTAEPNGDFVAVLDQPLPPGDYNIVLRATEEDGDVAMSEETAIVSVPEPGREGEVLALVEKPGEPSRLINTPEPSIMETDESGAVEQAEAQGGEEATEVASANAGAEPEQGGEAAETAEAQAGPPDDAQETEVASVETEDKPAAQASGESAQPAIAIAAVEIENDMVFVAGVARPGSQVRVYANEFLLGDTVAGPGGEFLVEARRDLPVGDYIIRADVIDPATAEVRARVAVPFTREPGERVAAVAEAGGAGEAEESADTETAAAPQAEGSQASPDAAETEQAAAAPSDQGQAEAAATADAATADATTGDAAAEAGSASAETGEAAEPAAAGEQVAAADDGKAGTGAGDAVQPAEVAEAATETAAAEPEADAAPDAGTDVAQAGATESTDVAEVEQAVAAAAEVPAAEAAGGPPKVSEDLVVRGTLRRANSSVIIRRGDTLWHISRRIYGQGIRYTTIYLANQKQISDPDRIWPGQIFELPKAAAPEN